MESLPAFVGNLIIVLVTAALIPLIFRFVDDRKAARQRTEDDLRQRKQMVFEADLSRQSKVLEAQVRFLEQLAELLWKYQLMAIDVSYYHQFDLGDQYQEATKQYLAEAGELLGKVRGEISKSLRLCSQETYDKLKQLYYNRLLEFDKNLTMLIADSDRQRIGGPSWQTFNSDAVHKLSQEVDEIIHDLAAEFGLTGQSLASLDHATPAMSST